jgi:hypothetical protein
VRDETAHPLRSRLSQSSLDALEGTDEAAPLPQPPLAVYLAQSYQEEAAELSAVQAAIDNGSLSGSGSFEESAWSGARRGSLVTSVVSSEGTRYLLMAVKAMSHLLVENGDVVGDG